MYKIPSIESLALIITTLIRTGMSFYVTIERFLGSAVSVAVHIPYVAIERFLGSGVNVAAQSARLEWNGGVHRQKSIGGVVVTKVLIHVIIPSHFRP